MPIDKTANHTKIIAAAKKEFLTYGFTDASMRHIAEEAGTSASGLYKHFAGREEIMELIEIVDGNQQSALPANQG